MNERMSAQSLKHVRSSPCRHRSAAATRTLCVCAGWLFCRSNANCARIFNCVFIVFYIVCSSSYYYHYYCLYYYYGCLLYLAHCCCTAMCSVVCSVLLTMVVLPATRCRSSIGALVWQFCGLAVPDSVWFYFGFVQLCREIMRLLFSTKNFNFFIKYINLSWTLFLKLVATTGTFFYQPQIQRTFGTKFYKTV